MARRLAITVVLAGCMALAATTTSQAVPGALNILLAENCPYAPVKDAIAAQPGVANVTSFDTNAGTPTAADLATRDLVVSGADCSMYDDAALWGDRLAGYVDGGGAVLQAAYDNRNVPNAHPTGRFESGGYPPLLLGPNDNDPVTLGPVLVPNSPLMQGIGAFSSTGNTTTPLAPGATLLARWSDGRNAIAIKGRVVATSAQIQEASATPSVARLARNTGNFIRRYRVSVAKTGAGTGTVSSVPGGISCGLDCSENIPFANSVTLSATAGAKSVFLGFTGACTGTARCTRRIESDLSVGASFASTRRCGNPQTGTSAADTLTGSIRGDRLLGRRGNDVLNGLAGDDCLGGDSGSDRLSGGSGADSASGGGGGDRVSGGAGRDRLSGGSGNDRLGGGSGGDRLTGGSGRDRVSGNSGNDRINVRDRRRDRVNCGSGFDRVKADRRDVLVRCERVARR
jgi:hypothetical protein